MTSDAYIPNFIGIFGKKVSDLKDKIKKELEKPKKERNKEVLKALTKDAKKLQKKIKGVKDQTAFKCPHCGEKINL